MTPAEQAERIVNQYLACSDATYLDHLIVAAIEQTRREERRDTLVWAWEHGILTRTQVDEIVWQERALAAEERIRTLEADAKELRETLDDTRDQFRRVADEANQAKAEVAMWKSGAEAERLTEALQEILSMAEMDKMEIARLREIVEWYWSPMHPESPKSEDLARRIAAAIEQARREEREACISDVRFLAVYADAMDPHSAYDNGWCDAVRSGEAAIRARAQESGS